MIGEAEVPVAIQIDTSESSLISRLLLSKVDLPRSSLIEFALWYIQETTRVSFRLRILVIALSVSLQIELDQIGAAGDRALTIDQL